MGSVLEIRERRQDFMPLNFSVEDILLIVQLPVLFNTCIKPGVFTDVFPQASRLRIPAEDVLGYALAHPESSVRSGILARLVPTQNRRCGTYYIHTLHIFIVQSWRKN
ncbi:uncharacterized protein TNCV_4815591 [Trichonephila clavipes]|nr:uncharacterized protein TNCV_4815591 [Trichonephila clavipes]